MKLLVNWKAKTIVNQEDDESFGKLFKGWRALDFDRAAFTENNDSILMEIVNELVDGNIEKARRLANLVDDDIHEWFIDWVADNFEEVEI